MYDRRACRGLAALGWSVHGLLVPPGDPQTLGQTLSCWLGDPRERQRLRAAARSRRQRLSDWAQTSRELSAVLSEVAR